MNATTRRGWTMAEAAKLSQDSVPGATSMTVQLMCVGGERRELVAPWNRKDVVRVVRAYCKRWGLTPSSVSPVISYCEWQLPYLVRLDLVINF